MRYAYVKYGNVVDEIKKVGTSPQLIPKTGPLTFIANFAHHIGNSPALLISWDNHCESNKSYARDNILAITNVRPKGLIRILAGASIFTKLFRFRPDIVLCVHDGPGLWACYLLCAITGSKLIHSRQRSIKAVGDRLHRRITRMIDCWVIRRAVGVICHGPFTRHQLIEAGVKIDRIIEFDVEFDDHITQSPKYKPDSSALSRTVNNKLLFLGRIEASKGVFELFNAILPLLSKYDDLHMVYIGDGNALFTLKKMANQNGVADKVSFTGRVPHNEVYDHLKSATLLVTPTRRGLEGWPMAALEGLSMGVPVIAPDAGPFQFMIENRVNGLFYNDGSVDDLRHKIETIIENPGLRDDLARGAISKTKARRDMNIKGFGEALSFALSHLAIEH